MQGREPCIHCLHHRVVDSHGDVVAIHGRLQRRAVAARAGVEDVLLDLGIEHHTIGPLVALPGGEEASKHGEAVGAAGSAADLGEARLVEDDLFAVRQQELGPWHLRVRKHAIDVVGGRGDRPRVGQELLLGRAQGVGALSEDVIDLVGVDRESWLAALELADRCLGYRQDLGSEKRRRGLQLRRRPRHPKGSNQTGFHECVSTASAAR